MSIALHKIATADKNHMIHIQLPADISDRVEVFIKDLANQDASSPDTLAELTEEQRMLLFMQSDTGFAKNVLLNPAEDVWNDL